MDKKAIEAYKKQYPMVFERFSPIMDEDVLAEGIAEFDGKSKEDLLILLIEGAMARALFEKTAEAMGVLNELMELITSTLDGMPPSEEGLPKA